MNNTAKHDERISKKTFASVYPLYLTKVEKKVVMVKEIKYDDYQGLPVFISRITLEAAESLRSFPDSLEESLYVFRAKNRSLMYSKGTKSGQGSLKGTILKRSSGFLRKVLQFLSDFVLYLKGTFRKKNSCFWRAKHEFRESVNCQVYLPRFCGEIIE